MEKKIIFELESLYRSSFRVTGFKFGQGEKSACIVGALRGNEVQQLYTCSQLVKAMKRLEERGEIEEGRSVLVIPSVNPYSMNIQKRFWPNDNTDINRMFPGYSLGETTQRIAAGLFDEISGYKYGIQFASFYIPGVFVPHVRIMRTGYENAEMATGFGLPYVLLRTPRPYDTTTLNYNWQIWDAKAFSLYAGTTEHINYEDAEMSVKAVINFLRKEGVLKSVGFIHSGYISSIIDEKSLIYVRAKEPGLMRAYTEPGKSVEKGEQLMSIIDPYDGSVREEILSPVDGIVFFAQENPLVVADAAVCRIIPERMD